MGIKYLNRDSLLDFPNVSGPNGSSSDSETGHGVGSVGVIHRFTVASVTAALLLFSLLFQLFLVNL